jgi:CRP/FNR family transcriptional regulator, cyclic AMP receptor protein
MPSEAPRRGMHAAVLRSPQERAAWESSFLDRLPLPVQRELHRSSAAVSVSAGDKVYSASGPARLALIVSGLCRVFISSADGRHATIRYARSGNCIGVISVVTARQSVNAEAMTACEAVFLDVPTVRRLAQSEPRVGWVFAQAAGVACTDAIDLMTTNLFGHVRQRVARHLLDLAAREGDVYVVRTDQQEIADAVGSVREVVARALRSFKDNGSVVRTPEGLRLLDVAALHTVAFGD